MNNKETHYSPSDISEQDIIEAMKTLGGHVDITVGDFRQIYQIAYNMIRNRLLNTVAAKNLMTREVLQLEQTLPLVQATSLLAEKQVSGAPVVDSDQKIVGIVTEKDFLKEMGFGSNPSFMQLATHCLHDKSCMIGNLRGRTIADIMSKHPLIVSQEVTVGDISTIFAERKINHLPIVDPNGLIVGIVTRTDLARAYHALAEDR